MAQARGCLAVRPAMDPQCWEIVSEHGGAISNSGPLAAAEVPRALTAALRKIGIEHAPRKRTAEPPAARDVAPAPHPVPASEPHASVDGLDETGDPMGDAVPSGFADDVAAD